MTAVATNGTFASPATAGHPVDSDYPFDPTDTAGNPDAVEKRVPFEPAVHVGAHITGWGWALPATVVTNKMLEVRLDTDDAWITSRTGIRQRRLASDDETTGPLAIAAGRDALRCAHIDASAVDLVIVATCTPELPMPSTASLVAAALGITGSAFDLNAACAGFVQALTVATSMIGASVATRALVIGADTMSRIVDPADRATAVLFGDGAAAIVLDRPSSEQSGDGATPGLIATDAVTDGTGSQLLVVAAGGARRPASLESVGHGDHFVKMEGRTLFRQVVRGVVESVERTLARAGYTIEDVDWFMPHQANARITDAIVERLAMSPSRVLANGDRFGNTSAASVPLLLAESASTGTFRDGDVILLCGFGAGLSLVSVLWRWGSP